MTTLTMRSATLAACATLLIAGTTMQASAVGKDEHPGPGVSTDKGYDNITVIGNNNNAAGNDLIVGNNSTSGTGHTLGAPALSWPVQVHVYNCSGETLTFEYYTGTTTSPPSSIPAMPASSCGTTVAGSWSYSDPAIALADVYYTAPGSDDSGIPAEIHFSAANSGFGIQHACTLNPEGQVSGYGCPSSDDGSENVYFLVTKSS